MVVIMVITQLAIMVFRGAFKVKKNKVKESNKKKKK